MTVIPVNVADVTEAVLGMLANDTRFSQVTAERAGALNERPGVCPWIGVYRSATRFVPRLIGMGQQGVFDQKIDLVVLAQESDGTSGAECEVRLEQLISNLASVLLSDPSLAGTVLGLESITVRYDSYDQLASKEYMQTAAIYITATARVSFQ